MVSRSRRYAVAVVLAGLGGLILPVAFPFTVPIHVAITDEVLKAFTTSLGGSPHTFSARATDEIEKANAATDTGGSAALYHPERHYTNEDFPAASQHIIDLKADILSKLRQSTADGSGARVSLGQAFHTIQDFYAHSNWVESNSILGPVNINGDLGISTEPMPPASLLACPSDPSTLAPNGGGGVTSGYFVPQSLFSCFGIPTGKCAHGNYTFLCRGINKDHAEDPNHPLARALAKQSSSNFLQSIVTALAGNDKAVAALLDVKGQVAFVIDTTGSMGDEIADVKASVQQIVNSEIADPNLAPDGWVLEPFNDPTYGPVFTTPDASALLSAVGALTASGGGDCPELSQHGLQQAVASAAPGSSLFFFSDASAKDESLANSVISLAQSKNITLYYLNTGSCSPIDPAYIRGASETGGVFFYLNRSEVGQVGALVTPLLAGNSTRILNRQGTFSPSVAAKISIPVDSTVSQFTVSISMDTKTGLTLSRPSGVNVGPSDTDVQFTNLSTGAVITVKNPGTGTWTVSLTGSGSYTVSADAVSPLQLWSAALVEPGGDIHGGFVPIAGQPITGSAGLAEATVLGNYASVQFSMVDLSGRSLGQLSLVQNYPLAIPTDFIGTVPLPTVPFRIDVTGQDVNGSIYLRENPKVFRPQQVGVQISGATAALVPAGKASTFLFTVTNSGAAGQFNVLVVDKSGFVANPVPASLNLAAGASATVAVTVTIPASAAGNTDDVVTLTATSSSDVSQFNSANLDLTVVAKTVLGDVNGDGRVDCTDLTIVKTAFGATRGQLAYDPRADLNSDGAINVLDLSIVARNTPTGTACQ